MGARRSWRRCDSPRNLPQWPGRRRAPPDLCPLPSLRARQKPGIWRREPPPSVFEFLAERLVASAAAVFPKIAKGRLYGGLVAALYGHEKCVGLGGGSRLSVKELVPVTPNHRFGCKFPV